MFREQTRCEKEDAIIGTVTGLLENKSHIYNSADIARTVRIQHDQKVSTAQVCSILKTHFNMLYRKIRRTSYLGNYERSLTLRLQYAKIMLDLLA